MNEATSSKRTWRPFSGGQLTVIIVTFMVGVMLVPGTVWAVGAFSNVAVQDPISGVKASVDATHHLAVAGKVTGTVHAIAASPTLPFTFSEDIGGPTQSRVVGPVTTAINLTAISVSPKGATGSGDFFLYVGSQPSSEASCDLSISFTLYHVPSMQSSPVFVQSFPTPLVIPAPASGQKTCLYADIDTNVAWTVNGSGFLGG